MPCATSELSIIQLPISSALGIGQLPPITPWECPLCWGGTWDRHFHPLRTRLSRVHHGPEGGLSSGPGGTVPIGEGKAAVQLAARPLAREAPSASFCQRSPRGTAGLTLCHSGFMRPHLILRASPVHIKMGRGALGQVAPAWPAAHTRGAGEELAGICEPWAGRRGLGLPWE